MLFSLMKVERGIHFIGEKILTQVVVLERIFELGTELGD